MKFLIGSKQINYLLMLVKPIMKADEMNIILDNTRLDRVNNTKFLGVIIDENLTWKNHVDCISKIVSKNIGVMNKLKHYIPYRILHTLYCTLVLPYLNYGILIWGNTYKSYLDKSVKTSKMGYQNNY